MKAISFQIKLNRYAPRYDFYFLKIATDISNYETERFYFDENPVNLKTLVFAEQDLVISLCGIQVQYGVFLDPEYLTESVHIEVSGDWKSYLFGNGQQIGLLSVVRIHDIPFWIKNSELSHLSCYALETMQNPILVFKKRYMETHEHVYNALIATLEKSFETLPNPSKYETKEELLLWKLNCIQEWNTKKVQTIKGKKRYQGLYSHLETDSFAEYTFVLSPIEKKSQEELRPTTKTINRLYNTMTAHQYEHKLVQYKESIKEDMDAVFVIAKSFLSRKQSHNKLQQLIQRTKATLSQITELVSVFIQPCKEMNHKILYKLLISSIDALEKCNRSNFLADSESRNVLHTFKDILDHIDKLLFVSKVFKPFESGHDLLDQEVLEWISISILMLKKAFSVCKTGVLNLFHIFTKTGFLLPIYLMIGVIDYHTVHALKKVVFKIHCEQEFNDFCIEKKAADWIISIPFPKEITSRLHLQTNESIQLIPIIYSCDGTFSLDSHSSLLSYSRKLDSLLGCKLNKTIQFMKSKSEMSQFYESISLIEKAISNSAYPIYTKILVSSSPAYEFLILEYETLERNGVLVCQ